MKTEDRGLVRFTRWVVTLLGGAIGLGLAQLALHLWRLLHMQGALAAPATPREAFILHIALFFGLMLLFFAFSRRIASRIIAFLHRTEEQLDQRPLLQVFAAAVGLILGLVIALLLTQLLGFWEAGLLKTTISVVMYLILGYLGLSIFSRRWRELSGLGTIKRTDTKQRREGLQQATGVTCTKKILDTSVIIDGRIFDICKTGFVEGILVVPQFVLKELQHIADSSDSLRRNRGRRGLDVLQKIQKELDVTVEIVDNDFPDVDEVDVKLLKLAQEIGGVVMTNDYNLNKVASVTGVHVLNINELANALKPVVLHGEGMQVHIVREGKEPGQGVGYLDDGTMIVVDNGKQFVGQSVEVMVTTVLQTAAGRMIFTKMKHEDGIG